MQPSASHPVDHVAAALRAGGILRALSEPAALRLARSGRPVDLARGAVLAQAGDPGDAMFVILEGEIEVRTVSPDGREVRLAALGPGAVVGEMAVLDGGERSADMIAARRCRLWRIAREALHDLLHEEPELALALVRELSARLRRTNADLENRATQDLGGRLARLLAAEQGGRGLIALNQGELARRIGASREKVNRKLRQWADAGWVEVTPAGVRILSAEALRAAQARGAD
jgi:CRP-like cAMP-binding protein